MKVTPLLILVATTALALPQPDRFDIHVDSGGHEARAVIIHPFCYNNVGPWDGPAKGCAAECRRTGYLPFGYWYPPGRGLPACCCMWEERTGPDRPV
ncbi:uncharacterized protein LOC62_02G002386 [Vanrija pseudolonga]|uniref:Uncharacterized protein n=1 Tax=Vanrija pseudolonga TaxID=143232 RepID=A0AAF0Y2J0_9TREE|nr:hypothetical protein LOC62_02G002386 [Vanrija pseudolonga]